jgi:hypothetical protein
MGQRIVGACQRIVGACQRIVGACQCIVGACQSMSEHYCCMSTPLCINTNELMRLCGHELHIMRTSVPVQISPCTAPMSRNVQQCKARTDPYRTPTSPCQRIIGPCQSMSAYFKYISAHTYTYPATRHRNL